MTNQYSLTCPTCKIERQVTKDNYNFHIRTKSLGQCRPCRIKEFNSRSENKRGYVNGIPAKKHDFKFGKDVIRSEVKEEG